MELLEKIFSKNDNTIKYVFKLDNEKIIELSYINKDDGKDIICVPSQTSCSLGCKFCHITDIKDKLVTLNIESYHIIDSVNYVVDDLDLTQYKRTLLISFMGCGEPLLNVDNITNAMVLLSNKYQDKLVPHIRYAIATSIPKNKWLNFYKLTDNIIKHKLPVKMHLSLHYTNDKVRKEWMPNSLEVKKSISLLENYKLLTDNSVEIHYALIDDLNDTWIDAVVLSELLKNKNIPVKFLFFNEKPSLEYHRSTKNKLKTFTDLFKEYSIDSEYYIPPGLDVGASCGQFLMEYYIKYNSKK